MAVLATVYTARAAAKDFAEGMALFEKGDALAAEPLVRHALEAEPSTERLGALMRFVEEAPKGTNITTSGLLLADFAADARMKAKALRLVLRSAHAIKGRDMGNLRQAEMVKRLVMLHAGETAYRAVAERSWLRTIGNIFERDTDGSVLTQLLRMVASPDHPRADARLVQLACKALELYGPKFLQRRHDALLRDMKIDDLKPC